MAAIDNYDRLAYLLLNEPIEKVLILGDLFHSHHNSEWDLFKDFLQKFPKVAFELVKGNHDILEQETYDLDNFRMLGDLLEWGPFAFSHEPIEREGLYNLCGHIHPGVRIVGRGKQSMRLPCFYFTENQAIMPAFGTFTGLHCLEIKKGDDVFVLADNTIIKLG